MVLALSKMYFLRYFVLLLTLRLQVTARQIRINRHSTQIQEDTGGDINVEVTKLYPVPDANFRNGRKFNSSREDVTESNWISQEAEGHTTVSPATTTTNTDTEVERLSATSEVVSFMGTSEVLQSSREMDFTAKPVEDSVTFAETTEMSFAEATETFPEPVEEVTLNPSEVTLNSSEVTLNSSEVTLNSSEVTLNPSEVTLNPTEVTLNPSEVTLNPSEVTLNPFEVTLNTSEVIFNPSEVTLNPSEVTLNPSEVTLNPSEVTLNPSSTQSPTPVDASAIPRAATPHRAPYPPAGYRPRRPFWLPFEVAPKSSDTNNPVADHPVCGSNDNPIAPKPAPGAEEEPDAERVLITTSLGPTVVATPVASATSVAPATPSLGRLQLLASPQWAARTSQRLVAQPLILGTPSLFYSMPLRSW